MAAGDLASKAKTQFYGTTLSGRNQRYRCLCGSGITQRLWRDGRFVLLSAVSIMRRRRSQRL